MSTLKTINVTHPTSATNNITLDSSGNVGIGTSSPGNKLDVAGNQGFTTAAYVFSYAGGTSAQVRSGIQLDGTNQQTLFFTGTNERMRIDSSGNVGIGNSAPSSFNSSANKLVVGTGSGNNGITIYSGSASQSGIYFGYGTTGAQAYAGQFIYNHANNSFSTYVSGTTLATTIDSSGNLLVGTTTLTQRLSVTGSSEIGGFQNTSGTGNVRFYNSGGTTIGYIQWSGASTSYVTSSDYRLKEDVLPMASGLATVSALRPVTYKWKEDGSAGEGFIAHELKEVIPFAVTGEKDAVDADGKPEYQGVDYSKIVVHLVAAIQELSAKNDALEARLAALESK